MLDWKIGKQLQLCFYGLDISEHTVTISFFVKEKINDYIEMYSSGNKVQMFESRYMKIFSRTGILNVVNHVAVSTVVVGRESCETIRFL